MNDVGEVDVEIVQVALADGESVVVDVEACDETGAQHGAADGQHTSAATYPTYEWIKLCQAFLA